MLVHVIRDVRCSLDHSLGDSVETFIRREDAERFIEEVRGDDPDLASYLRIEERETEAALGSQDRRSHRAILRGRWAFDSRPEASVAVTVTM